MKAIVLTKENDNLNYEIQDLNTPEPHSDQVLIKTKAFSLNPIDLKTLRGNKFTEKLLAQSPSILGWDAAGIVENTGQNIDSLKPGDAVMGMVNFPDFGRTFADYVLARPEDLVKVPSNFSFAEAAALPLAGLTAFQAIKKYCTPGNGKRILIHAGGGGVGHLGLQIAKHFGLEVLTTASDAKKDFVMECGADKFIDYKNSDFEDVIDAPVDAVFDLIGGDYIDKSLRVLKEDGVLISIPSSTNADVEEKAREANKKGVRFKVQNDQENLQELSAIFEKAHNRVVVSKEFTWNEIDQAIEHLEDGHVKGKIIVKTD